MFEKFFGKEEVSVVYTEEKKYKCKNCGGEYYVSEMKEQKDDCIGTCKYCDYFDDYFMPVNNIFRDYKRPAIIDCGRYKKSNKHQTGT